jgi:hypothetical protein
MKDASPEMMSLFCGLLERAPGKERAAYLDAACGQDRELRARIEALLQAHEQAGGFLRENSVVGDPWATVDDPIKERPGTFIGPYKLLEQIGEGGFGVVFLAMAQERLGKAREARQAYDAGCTWLEANRKAIEAVPTMAGEMQRLQAEVKGLLALKKEM